jgi:hypothetical protein
LYVCQCVLSHGVLRVARMPKKAARPTPRGGFASTGKSEHRLKRAALKRAASKRPKWRADTLHFPEEAQAIVCGLLCELRLAEVPVDSDDAKRLRRYATAPHKVLKELVSRSACPPGRGGTRDEGPDAKSPTRAPTQNPRRRG